MMGLNCNGLKVNRLFYISFLWGQVRPGPYLLVAGDTPDLVYSDPPQKGSKGNGSTVASYTTLPVPETFAIACTEQYT